MRHPNTGAYLRPEFVVNVVRGWSPRDFLHRIYRIAEGSA